MVKIVYLVDLVYLVILVHFVYLVCFVKKLKNVPSAYCLLVKLCYLLLTA